ncbi:MAG TPA: hypothetical protein VMW13_03620 [Dehalococcoidales bacterium]|nr:hypothetical protein [Dehalococcoidales bacterium]
MARSSPDEAGYVGLSGHSLPGPSAPVLMEILRCCCYNEATGITTIGTVIDRYVPRKRCDD